MNSQDFNTFQSWDDVSVGDHLVFKDVGHHSIHIVVEFERIEHSPFSRMIGSIVEDPSDTYGSNTEWSSSIFNDGPYGSGWALVRREYQYDPSQQGDTEDDI